MPVNQIVQCGLQSQTIVASSGTLVIEVDKNEGVRNILSSENLADMFSLADEDRCLINSFSLHTT